MALEGLRLVSDLPTAKRLRFRHLNRSDDILLDRELNVPEVTGHLGGVLDRKKQRELFRWLFEDQQEEYGHTFWPIELNDTGKFVGLCGLVTVDEQDSTVLGALELGYRITPASRGNRYSIEASAACLQFAFEQKDCWWVVSRTIVQNIGSWSVMKAIGMRHDPRLDYVSKDGTQFIVHVMTLDDWKATGRKICQDILASPARAAG